MLKIRYIIFLAIIFQLLPAISQADTVKYCNARILRNHQIEYGDLWVKDGKIADSSSNADLIKDMEGYIIAPGFIDLQINGAFGVDFTTEPSRVLEVAQQLTQYGVTAFLPTVITTNSSDYPTTIATLVGSVGQTLGATILGIHLEGPFINKKNKGAHAENFIVDPDLLVNFEDVQRVYGNLDGVKLITLAPEILQSTDVISSLREQGIVVSVGHSSASFADVRQAFDAGAGLVTHLFNAMAPLEHRNPGIITFALSQHKMKYSLIVDGVHLAPATVSLAWNAHSEGLVLITDAIAALGIHEKECRLGGRDLLMNNGAAYIKGTSTFAGSVLSMDQAVRNLRNYTTCSIVEALEAASLKPAIILGLNQKGSLSIGADADFVVLDDNLFVRATYVGGLLVWSKLSLIL